MRLKKIIMIILAGTLALTPVITFANELINELIPATKSVKSNTDFPSSISIYRNNLRFKERPLIIDNINSGIMFSEDLSDEMYEEIYNSYSERVEKGEGILYEYNGVDENNILWHYRIQKIDDLYFRFGDTYEGMTSFNHIPLTVTYLKTLVQYITLDGEILGEEYLYNEKPLIIGSNIVDKDIKLGDVCFFEKSKNKNDYYDIISSPDNLYSIGALEFEGYEPLYTQTTYDCKTGRRVFFYYKPIKDNTSFIPDTNSSVLGGGVEIYYRDEEGNMLAAPRSMRNIPNGVYNLEAIEIEGYKPVEKMASIKIGQDFEVLEFTYKKNTPFIPIAATGTGFFFIAFMFYRKRDLVFKDKETGLRLGSAKLKRVNNQWQADISKYSFINDDKEVEITFSRFITKRLAEQEVRIIKGENLETIIKIPVLLNKNFKTKL